MDDEIKAWRRAGIDAVVSLLTADEEAHFGLERERPSCEANGVGFYSLPIIDRGVPSSDTDTARLLGKLNTELTNGKNIAVHCRQGIGRSGLIAAGLLVEKGLSPAEAIRRVSSARHLPVPETPEQRAWIDSFAATVEQKR